MAWYNITKKSSKDNIVIAKLCPDEVTEKPVKPGALWLQATLPQSINKGKNALVNKPYFICSKVGGQTYKSVSGVGLKKSTSSPIFSKVIQIKVCC